MFDEAIYVGKLGFPYNELLRNIVFEKYVEINTLIIQYIQKNSSRFTEYGFLGNYAKMKVLRYTYCIEQIKLETNKAIISYLQNIDKHTIELVCNLRCIERQSILGQVWRMLA